MGTGCSVARDIQPTIQHMNNSISWRQLEPIQTHKVTITESSLTAQVKLSIATNDCVLWTFIPGLVTKWRVIEVFKHGSSYLPIEGGINIVLDYENDEIETIFHFPIKMLFAIVEDGIEFEPGVTISYFIRIIVATRNPIRCPIIDTGFEFPHLIGQIGLPVVFVWKNLSFPISIARGEIDLQLQSFRVFTHYDSELGRSGQIIFTPNRSGVATFAIFGGIDEVLGICSVRSYTQTLGHLVEIGKGSIYPLVSEIISGTPVLFHLSDTDILFSDERVDYPSRPRIKRPYLYKTLTRQGIYNFVTRDEMSSVSGFIMVLPAPKRHQIQYSSQGFDSVLLKCKIGDFICFNSQVVLYPPIFSVFSAQARQSNDRDLFVLSGRLIDTFFASGYIEYRVSNMGVHLFKTDQHLVVIASNSPQTHNILINQKGFHPFTNEITQGDSVLWYWGRDASPHNIVQVSFEGDRIPDSLNPFHSGVPTSNSGFHHQFDKVGNYYYISEGHGQAVRGEIVVWPQNKVHTIVCTPSIVLKPINSQVCVNDWVVWISPPHLQIKVQFESALFDIAEYLTPLSPNCCALFIPVKGLVQLVLNVEFMKVENTPSIPVPYFLVCDQMLAHNTVHLPLTVSKNEMFLYPGDFILLNSNCDMQITVFLSSVSSDETQPIAIPLGPLDRIMITFWREGVYEIEFMMQIVLIHTSLETQICKAPSMPIIEWNETTVQDSVFFETGQNIFYTLDSSYPILNSPNTQIMAKNTLKFNEEGFVILRVIAFQENTRHSKVHTSPPIHISNCVENFCFRPTFSYQTVSHTSVIVMWSYSRAGVENIYKYSLFHLGAKIVVESQNSAILYDLLPERDQQVILEISDYESCTLLESITFKFYFPFYKDTIAPEILIDKDPPSNLARICWERHINTLPVVNEYTMYVDGQLNCRIPAVYKEGPIDKGDESKCVVLLEDLEEGEVYNITVSALATTLEGKNIAFNSPQIPFHNIHSKSMTTESPKVSTSDVDSGGFSVESDEMDGTGKTVPILELKREPKMETQKVEELQDEGDLENLEGIVPKDKIDSLGQKSEKVGTFVTAPFSEEETTLMINVPSQREGSQSTLTESSRTTLTSKHPSLILDSNKTVERLLNSNLRVELTMKEYGTDFVEVSWCTRDEKQELIEANFDSINLELNGNLIYSGIQSNGEFRVEGFENGSIHCLCLVALVCEYSLNPIRHSSNIFFAKVGDRLPVLLKFQEIAKSLKNKTELAFDGKLNIPLSSFELSYTKQTRFMKDELTANFHELLADFLQYEITETAPSGKRNTFSNSTPLQTNDIKNSNIDLPSISCQTEQNLVTVHSTNPGHSYTISLTIVYSKTIINMSQNNLYILPVESVANEIHFISPAPPTATKPILTYIDRSEIKIKWNEATIVTASVIGYAVFINGTAHNEIFTISHLHFTLDDPQPGQTYSFTILGLTNHPCGNSAGILYEEFQPISAYDSCKFSPPLVVEFNAILPLPSIKEIVPCFGTSVKVIWELERKAGVFLTPNCFALLWKPVDVTLECDMKQIVYKPADSYSYKLLGLLPWTQYELKITVYANDPSGKEKFIETQTESCIFVSPGPPLPPMNLTPEVVWFDKIRVSWDPMRNELLKLVSFHIWAFVYYESKVFVRFEKVACENCCFEMEGLISDTAYLIEFYSVRDDLKLLYEKSVDAIEAYEVKSRILLSLHTCVRFSVQTLSLNLDVELKVVANMQNQLEVYWGEINFPGTIDLYSYTLECGLYDKIENTLCEESSNWRQIFTVDPEQTNYTIKDVVTGLLYQIQLKGNLLQPNSTETPVPFTVLLKETSFRLPAPPEKPVLFISEINPTTLTVSWNKSLTHHSVDSNIKTLFKGYNFYLNDLSQRILHRNATKYSVCLNRSKTDSPNVYRVKLVALGHTLCKTRDEKTLTFEETNESKVLEIDFGCFGEYFVSCAMHYIDLTDCTNHSDSIEGCVTVSWGLNSSIINKVLRIKLIWWYKSEEKQHEFVLQPSQTEFQIENPIPKLICVAQISLNLAEDTIFSPNFECQIPSFPEAPIIQKSDNTNSKGVTVKWHEPRQYGDILITGYQMYNDDIVIGPVLESISFEAFLPIKSSENYNLKLQALTRHQLPRRIFSNTLSTFDKPNESSKLSIKHRSIEAFLKEVKSQSIEVGWNYTPSGDKVPNHFRIEWSCVSHPVPKVSLLPHTLSSHTIRECVPGVKYFIHVKAMSKFQKVLSVSVQINIQTPAPPSTPQIEQNHVNSENIHLEWKTPIQYGDAKISEFVLFIDRTNKVKIEKSENSFEFKALPCREYTFRLQALTNHSVGNSKLSNTLVIATTGLKVPDPTQVSSGKLDSISVTWDTIVSIGNVIVDKIDVFCPPKNHFLENVEKYLLHPDCISHVDLTSDISEDTFHSLTNQSSYYVFLRATDTEGAKYYSELTEMSTAMRPEPPNVIFTNLSLNKRNKCIEELMLEVNERDSLLLKLCWQQTKTVDIRTPKGQKICHEIAELSGDLLVIEKSILVKLKYLNSHSSIVSVLLRWEQVADTPEVVISGYEVLVNGTKHLILSHKQTNCTVEVNKSKFPNTVTICLRALTDHSIGTGMESEMLIFDWEQNFPTFSLFCLTNTHSVESRCCYLPSFEAERSNTRFTSLKELTTRGHFDSQDSPVISKVWNVFKEKIEKFPLKSHFGSQSIAIFWTFWCESSRKLVELFAKFAESYSSEMNFVCICMNSSDSCTKTEHISNLTAFIHSQSYHKTAIEFLCACGSEISPNPSETYSIFGVPSIAIFYPNGSLGWLGRHASKDFSDFETFLVHTSKKVLENECPIKTCQYCLPNSRPASSSFSIANESKTSLVKLGDSSKSFSTPSTAKSRQGGSARRDHSFSVYSTEMKPKYYEYPISREKK